MTDEPGPDVLVVSGALLDIVSLVPPERAGRVGGVPVARRREQRWCWS